MSAAASLRIGILQTDSVRDEFRATHGDYPDMFRSLLRAAAAAAGEPEPEFVDFDVRVGEYPAEIDACDAYLITGSRLSVYDDEPWIRRLEEFVRLLHDRRRKLVGICFGHQLVARALGGVTEPAAVGWCVGVHESRVLERPEWMSDQRATFSLLSSHKDQVTRLPEGARLLAANDDCPFAAFSVGDHFLCFQGHPEFTPPYAEALMRFRASQLGPVTFDRGIASLERDLDALEVARWMLAFMRQGGRAA